MFLKCYLNKNTEIHSKSAKESAKESATNSLSNICSQYIQSS